MEPVTLQCKKPLDGAFGDHNMAFAATFLAMTITKLELLFQGQQIGAATGFFLKKNSNWMLVSNWHVLAGRNNVDGQPRHSHGATPDECRFYVAGYLGDKMAWFPRVVNLGDAYNKSATWLEHPIEGQDVDIAVLPLGSIDVGFAKDLLDPTGYDPNMAVDLGAEVFLPGYPLGLAAAGKMAIWKRASIASSLEFGEGINRFIYVDTATREGMSGSPCLAISNWRHYSRVPGTTKLKVVERPLSSRLLGIYSGRKNPSDSFEAQIGIVWRENLIFETIAGETPATVRLR